MPKSVSLHVCFCRRTFRLERSRCTKFELARYDTPREMSIENRLHRHGRTQGRRGVRDAHAAPLYVLTWGEDDRSE